jgi:hypothetical protein
MGQGLDRDAADFVQQLPDLYFQPAATFLHPIEDVVLHPGAIDFE